MNLQEAGWTPDHPEETALAGSNRAGKRPAARTPSSKGKESPVQASQERPPPRGRKARKGLDEDLSNAEDQDEHFREEMYSTTVLPADEYYVTYLEIFPSKLDTNPPPKEMTFTSASRITHEIRMRAIAKGVDPSKFLRYGASNVRGKFNHYLMVVDDQADGDEIVEACGGVIRCVPDIPKDKTRNWDSFEYEWTVKVHDESEAGQAEPTRRAPKRGTSEELSVMVRLSCAFHFQFDKSHIAFPWEQSGWQVTYVGFPRVKVEGSNTLDRAPMATVKVRPPGHCKNTLCPGQLSMEMAGRQAILPRFLHLEIPFADQPPKQSAGRGVFRL